MSYEPKIYKDENGDRQVIASGGEQVVESGGQITIDSGGNIDASNATGSITFAAGEIDTTDIADDAVDNDKLADDAVDTDQLADGAVDTDQLAADAVTGAKIADDAVDSEHIADGAIDTAHIADDQVTHAKLDEGVDQCVDVTIATAAVKALNATPQTLVAAPGADKAIVFKGAVLFMDYATTAYDGIHADEDLSIKYTDENGLELANCEATGFLDQESDQVRYALPTTQASGSTAITPVANAAVVLHMLTGEIATGDSPLKIRTYYRVVPTTL